MTAKPAISFLNADSDSALVSDTSTIIGKMTDNPIYPTPSPALADVSAALNAFNLAIAAAADGGVSLTLAKNARRAELVSLLRTLAVYVQLASKGDLQTLLSSGFPAQKQGRTPVGPVAVPNAPVVAQGPVSGVLKATTSPVYGASLYNWSVALASAPDTDVQSAQTTGARAEFDGLTPGQVYVICLNAVGAAGASDWSDYGSLMVI